MTEAEKVRLLIVDDDPGIREVLQTSLTHAGYEVVTAANGREALQLATNKKFDLIVLDVMMPYVDGYHVAREIVSTLGSSAPKLLLITGRDTERESGVILMSGADAAIQKPFEPSDLIRKVEELLSERREP